MCINIHIYVYLNTSVKKKVTLLIQKQYIEKGLSTAHLLVWLVHTDSVFRVTSFIILILVEPFGRGGQRPPLSDTAPSITQYFKTSDTSIPLLWAHTRPRNVINQDFKVDRGPFYFKAPGDNDHYRTGEDVAHGGRHSIKMAQFLNLLPSTHTHT